MKWLEIIELRSASNVKIINDLDITDLLEGARDELKPDSIVIYRHETVGTDWSLHIHYDSEIENVQMSPLGLRLASALKETGLVNHTIWVERDNKQNKFSNKYIQEEM